MHFSLQVQCVTPHPKTTEKCILRWEIVQLTKITHLQAQLALWGCRAQGAGPSMLCQVPPSTATRSITTTWVGDIQGDHLTSTRLSMQYCLDPCATLILTASVQLMEYFTLHIVGYNSQGGSHPWLGTSQVSNKYPLEILHMHSNTTEVYVSAKMAHVTWTCSQCMQSVSWDSLHACLGSSNTVSSMPVSGIPAWVYTTYIASLQHCNSPSVGKFLILFQLLCSDLCFSHRCVNVDASWTISHAKLFWAYLSGCTGRSTKQSVVLHGLIVTRTVI